MGCLGWILAILIIGGILIATGHSTLLIGIIIGAVIVGVAVWKICE